MPREWYWSQQFILFDFIGIGFCAILHGNRVRVCTATQSPIWFQQHQQLRRTHFQMQHFQISISFHAWLFSRCRFCGFRSILVGYDQYLYSSTIFSVTFYKSSCVKFGSSVWSSPECWSSIILCAVLVGGLDAFHCDSRKWIFNKRYSQFISINSYWKSLICCWIDKSKWKIVYNCDFCKSINWFSDIISTFFVASFGLFILHCFITSTVGMSMDLMFVDLGRNALVMIRLKEVYWCQFSCEKNIRRWKVLF